MRAVAGIIAFVASAGWSVPGPAAGAQLRITGTVTPEPMVIGAPSVYTVTVRNTGDRAAQDVTILNTLDPSAAPGAVPPGCAVVDRGGAVSCGGAGLAIPPGRSVTYEIPVTIDSAVPDGTRVTHRVEVSAGGAGERSARMISPARAPGTVGSLGKAHSPGKVRPGVKVGPQVDARPGAKAGPQVDARPGAKAGPQVDAGPPAAPEAPDAVAPGNGGPGNGGAGDSGAGDGGPGNGGGCAAGHGTKGIGACAPDIPEPVQPPRPTPSAGPAASPAQTAGPAPADGAEAEPSTGPTVPEIGPEPPPVENVGIAEILPGDGQAGEEQGRPGAGPGSYEQPATDVGSGRRHPRPDDGGGDSEPAGDDGAVFPLAAVSVWVLGLGAPMILMLALLVWHFSRRDHPGGTP
ncbi:DUF11 domain-containing protein [Nonomuraea phyllanthi]|nr:DUF11 domain-containing protein [Nonomuraea phyllanthi]